MDNPTAIALVFLITVLVVFLVGTYFLYKNIGQHVTRALDETKDDPEAQAEIRKKIVKALYPPRFPRD